MHGKNSSQFWAYTLFVLLLVAAGSKCAELWNGSPYLDATDPVFTFLRQRWLVAAIASIEMAVACLLLSKVGSRLKGLAAAWLGGCFLTYQVLRHRAGSHGDCPCLGHLLSFLNLSQQTIESVTLAFAGTILALGLVLLVDEEKKPVR